MKEQIVDLKLRYLDELGKLIGIGCIANHVKGPLIASALEVCTSIESDLEILEQVSPPPQV
ncbi:hypothetical protein NYE44_25210 [Paenibacillus sp. FSL L8-0493]|uniref:hypothetical protein n=1 Tax=Paenibacillus sp. FSL L8-0493 TaxID=2975333 RepID=UPI0030FDC800